MDYPQIILVYYDTEMILEVKWNAFVARTWFKCRENKEFGFEKSVFGAESDSYGHQNRDKLKLSFGSNTLNLLVS